MSRAARIGMTLLLLSGITACGSAQDPASSSPTKGGRGVEERSGGTSRGPAKPTVPPRTSMTATTNATPPPYVDHVVWVSLPSGRSLQIYPTENGRVATADGAGAAAWREVLRKAPDAGTKGMRAQFDCHWAFARLAEPNKPSWNLEPWRPVVTAQQMYDARCNPGGPEV